MKAPASIGSAKAAAALGAACLAAFGLSLRAKGLVFDDAFIVGGDPLLKQGLRGALRLASTGYWEGAASHLARVEEYRPLLMETFLVQTSLGASQAALHAANVAIHFAVCLLLFWALRRHLRERAALFGALLFAVLPVHAEAIDLLTGRSELLSAAFLLGAWLSLEAGRPAKAWRGLLCYAAALLSKESAVLFPVILALGDWTLRGERPWAEGRRKLHAVLWSATFAFMALRHAVLAADFQGGRPYFPSRVTALATLPAFALKHYAWPAVSGLGLCTDFARPMIADGSLSSPAAWLLLGAAALAAAIAAGACLRRKAWAFAILGPALVLLPTSHLLMPLDTIGAQRFLYIPTMGAAALAGAWLGRLPLRAGWAGLGALLVWYASLSTRVCAAWSTPAGFYEAALACNPRSSRSMSALGASLIQAGDIDGGRSVLERAIGVDGSAAGPYYNLAVLAWQQRDPAKTAALALEAVKRDDADADGWTLLGAALAAQGRTGQARLSYEKALAIWPQDEDARYDLALLGAQAEKRP